MLTISGNQLRRAEKTRGVTHIEFGFSDALQIESLSQGCYPVLEIL